MSKALSDEEIAERLGEDDGDPSDTVALKRSTSGSRQVYHETQGRCMAADDRRYRAGAEEITRSEAQQRGLAPCRLCIIGYETPDAYDYGPQMVARTFDPGRHDTLREARAELEAGD